jgi:hypothetical protein
MRWQAFNSQLEELQAFLGLMDQFHISIGKVFLPSPKSSIVFVRFLSLFSSSCAFMASSRDFPGKGTAPSLFWSQLPCSKFGFWS